jgi:hypothetical protein
VEAANSCQNMVWVLPPLPLALPLPPPQAHDVAVLHLEACWRLLDAQALRVEQELHEPLIGARLLAVGVENLQEERRQSAPAGKGCGETLAGGARWRGQREHCIRGTPCLTFWKGVDGLTLKLISAPSCRLRGTLVRQQGRDSAAHGDGTGAAVAAAAAAAAAAAGHERPGLAPSSQPTEERILMVRGSPSLMAAA